MSFQSFTFLLFFAISLPLLLLTARRSWVTAERLLLLVSFLFACSFGKGALYLLFSAFITAFAVDVLTRLEEHRLTAFRLAVVFHVLSLCYFKYAGFFDGLSPVMPVGFSFFTFQQIWYLKECCFDGYTRVGYRRWLLASFFFPTLVSGPILRPGSLLPQLDSGAMRPTFDDASAGLYGFAVGMAKKVLLADSLAGIADKGWSFLADLTAPEAWCVIFAYSLQLYFDFSGYCDMATGLARMLGIRLPRNFDKPYRAVSVTDFWKRWHITLTSFLRECIYFPLGGSRKGKLNTYANILIVFLVSGLWHGAGWGFVLWGLCHGAFSCAERAIGEERLSRIPVPVRRGLTFLTVTLLWVFFRAPSVADAFSLLRTAVGNPFYLPADWLASDVLPTETEALRHLFPATLPLLQSLLALLLPAVALLLSMLKTDPQKEIENFRPTALRSVLTVLLLVWSLLSFENVSTFLYANF